MANLKPLSSKKPPVPAADHAIIAAWLADVRPGLNPVVTALDQLIVPQLSKPRYAIKWGKAYYGSEQFGWCIELVAYDVSVNIVFLNGWQLPQPPADGEQQRYVKIRTAEETRTPELSRWIKQSCHLPGWGWSHAQDATIR